MLKQKVYLILENLDQLINVTFGFVSELLILIEIYFS